MKTLCLAVVLAVCVSAAAARTAGGAVLAPVPSAALESFLEAGAHTDAEIDAMAQAEVAAVLGDADEAEHEGEHKVEAEAEAEAEHEVEADAEADAEMPRDTKAEEARQKRLARAKARAAAAARPPVPPPSALSAAAGGDSDIIRMVYDELNRLGAMSAPSAAAAAAAPASTLGVTDPRIRTLEHRLTSYENAAAEKSFKAKSGAINALATRLEGLDKTLAALKKSQEEQQALSARLLKATKAAEAKQDAGANAVDYSVGYVKATLPADFDAKVKAILGSVKTEARKIYERYCKRAGIKPKPDTPASYPTEKAGAAAPAAAAADTDAPAAAAPSEAAAAAGGASMAPLPASANPAVAEAAAVRRAKKAVVQGRPEKIMMKPIINGKEPTPEGMRLSKALNDISLALPITPAYALSAKEKALQDTLGEDAVNPKWKTKRI